MNRPRHFDLIAFDWDGTLFDSTALITHCIREAVRDVGGTVPTHEAASHVIGLGLMQALAHAAPDVPVERYNELGRRYRHHYSLSQDAITLFDGILEMLHDLKARGHLLAVATGKSRRGLDEALASTELRGIFDASRTADETAGKPDPLMLRELMEELGVAAPRLLMVGDTSHDLNMADNAVCASVAVSYGAHEPQKLTARGLRHVAPTVIDLRRWLHDHG